MQNGFSNFTSVYEKYDAHMKYDLKPTLISQIIKIALIANISIEGTIEKTVNCIKEHNCINI